MSMTKILSDDYFDIDAILSENQVFPTIFTQDAVDLGYLDANSGDADLKKGACVEMPLWLAEPLRDESYIEIDWASATAFCPRFLEQHRVEPMATNLKAKCEHWYLVGAKIAQIRGDAFMAQVLGQSLSARHKFIVDHSNSTHTLYDSHKMIQKLTHCEKALFDARLITTKHIDDWKNDKLEQTDGGSRKRRFSAI